MLVCSIRGPLLSGSTDRYKSDLNCQGRCLPIHDLRLLLGCLTLAPGFPRHVLLATTYCKPSLDCRVLCPPLLDRRLLSECLRRPPGTSAHVLLAINRRRLDRDCEVL